MLQEDVSLGGSSVAEHGASLLPSGSVRNRPMSFSLWLRHRCFERTMLRNGLKPPFPQSRSSSFELSRHFQDATRTDGQP